MSLLNDMLRDLIKQQPTRRTATIEQVNRGDAMDVADAGFTKFTKICLVFILVFTLVILVKHFITHPIHRWTLMATNETVAPHAPVKTQVHTTRIVPSVVAAQTTQEVKSVSEPVNNSLSDADQLKIDVYLAHAKSAIDQDKLTSPIEDNAYADYQKILQIDPNNSEAKQGLEFIAARYIARGQEQLKLGNQQQAQAYFQRAEYVATDYFQSSMETAAGIPASTQEPPATELPNQNNSLAGATAPQAQKKIVEQKTDLSTASEKNEKPAKEQAETSHLDITPNAAWKDEDSAKTARDFMVHRQVVEAKTILEKTLAVNAHSPQSLNLLHEIYLQESNFVSADQLVSRADFLTEDQRSLLQAQSLIAQAKEVQAIQLLEQHLNAAEDNESYRALLAGLYHKNGQYQVSVTQYQRLVNKFGDKPAYWLGLALGYDGLGQSKNAELCYQRLRKFPQLQPQVIAYVDKRLAALHVD